MEVIPVKTGIFREGAPLVEFLTLNGLRQKKPREKLGVGEATKAEVIEE